MACDDGETLLMLIHDHMQEMSQTRLGGGDGAKKHARSIGSSGSGPGSGGEDIDGGEVWLSCARLAVLRGL